MLNYYKDRLCLNVLTNSLENAKAIYEAANTYVAVGVLSINYPSVEEAVKDMQRYNDALDGCLSIGLGGGNPKQSKMVTAIAAEVTAKHINQAFTDVGATRALAKLKDAHINAMVAPSGEAGKVVISIGPTASECADKAIVPVDTAIAMIRDMGGDAIKFFPMKGLSTRDEFEAVAKACARNNLILEPTGGLDLGNLEEILTIALDAGVRKIVPHVYSSIIDPETGATRIDDVSIIMKIFDKVMEER